MLKPKISLIIAITVLCVAPFTYFIAKQNQIDTAEKLFAEFVKAQKANNFNRMKSISCPTFGSLSAEYNDKVF